VQLADEADDLAVQQHVGRAARMQRRVFGFHETQLQRCEQVLQVGLDVEEVDGAGPGPTARPPPAVGDAGHALRLVIAGHGQRPSATLSSRW
jgi:hypothetical protein